MLTDAQTSDPILEKLQSTVTDLLLSILAELVKNRSIENTMEAFKIVVQQIMGDASDIVAWERVAPKLSAQAKSQFYILHDAFKGSIARLFTAAGLVSPGKAVAKTLENYKGVIRNQIKVFHDQLISLERRHHDFISKLKTNIQALIESLSNSFLNPLRLKELLLAIIQGDEAVVKSILETDQQYGNIQHDQILALSGGFTLEPGYNLSRIDNRLIDMFFRDTVKTHCYAAIKKIDENVNKQDENLNRKQESSLYTFLKSYQDKVSETTSGIRYPHPSLKPLAVPQANPIAKNDLKTPTELANSLFERLNAQAQKDASKGKVQDKFQGMVTESAELQWQFLKSINNMALINSENRDLHITLVAKPKPLNNTPLTQPTSQSQSVQSVMEVPVVSSPILNQIPRYSATAVQQRQYAQDLYGKLVQILLDRINSRHGNETSLVKNFLPFIQAVRFYNGAYCIPLPLADELCILDTINDAINKIDIASEAGTILCQSVVQFVTDFKVIFIKSHGVDGFPNSAGLEGQNHHLWSQPFEFRIVQGTEQPKLINLTSQVLSLSQANQQAALVNSKIAESISDVACQTLVYHQTRALTNVKLTNDAVKNEYWLICFINPPTETLTLDATQPTETTATLLLARVKSNGLIDAFFEISKINSKAQEYNIALKLCDQLSPALKEMFINKPDEYSLSDQFTKDYSISSDAELKNILQEVSKCNGESLKILSLFALHMIDQAMSNDNKSVSKKTVNKRPLEDDSKVLPRKKQKISATESISNSATLHLTQNAGQKLSTSTELFTYLQSLQETGLSYALEVSAKIAEQKTHNFNFQAIVARDQSPLPEQETKQLDSYLSGTKLYDYQKECVKKIIIAHQNNTGMGIFDEMSLGKTIQIGAALYYLSLKTLNKAFLIVVPVQVLSKWQQELVAKLSFPDQQVIIFHGSNRTISRRELQSSNVIITTSETFSSELKEDFQTELKSAAGYFSKYQSLNASKSRIKIVKEWEECLPNIAEHIPGLLGSGRAIKFLRWPTEAEFSVLHSNFPISIKNLKLLCNDEIIFQYLIKEGYITKFGAMLKSIDNVEDLSQLYQDFPDLQTTKENLIDIFNKEYEAFSLQGIVLDEGHHGISNSENKTFLYFSPIARRLAQQKGLRLVATGTPFQNAMEELWTIHEFLNPGDILTRKIFMIAYENLLSNAGKSICKASECRKINNLDAFQRSLQDAANQTNKAYAQINQIIQIFKSRSIRRTKDLLENTASYGTTYRLPKREDRNVSWKLTQSQQQEFDTLDRASIESACRGFSFFHNNAESAETPSKSDPKGITILQKMAKIFDHPILVDPDHKAKLFNANLNYADIYQYLVQVLKNEYEDDIERFIAESGKLSALITNLRPLLNDPQAHILIATSFISMAAIIDLCVQRINQTKPLLYIGGISQEQRKEISNTFNRPHSSDEVHGRIVIVSQKAGGEGIDLYANYVFGFDATWTHALAEQIKSRAQRIHSPYSKVVCISYIGENPLDQKMASFINEKMEWGTWFVDHLPRCDIKWFVDRLTALIKTSKLFNPTQSIDEDLNQVISQLKLSLITSAVLSLDRVVSNPVIDVDSTQNNNQPAPHVSIVASPDNLNDDFGNDSLDEFEKAWEQFANSPSTAATSAKLGLLPPPSNASKEFDLSNNRKEKDGLNLN